MIMTSASQARRHSEGWDLRPLCFDEVLPAVPGRLAMDDPGHQGEYTTVSKMRAGAKFKVYEIFIQLGSDSPQV